MTITWLGHSCFLLEQEGYRLLTDPYEGVPGYPDIQARAHAVYCSHAHHDHAYRDGVTLLEGRSSPFSVREVQTFHDGQGGALRGENTVRIFSAGGVSVCHLGDLGHLLSDEQAEKVGRVDVLLVPVGGYFTIDADAAAQTARRLAPRCTVPMHYRHAPYGLTQVGGLAPFLAHYAPSDVRCLESDTFAVTNDLPPVVVPRYQLR